jgi:hypothetical protein
VCNPTNDQRPGTLVKRVASLLHSWWHSDRIRCPPAEGRLLRLRPPCYLRLRGEPLQVISRAVQELGGKTSVVYACHSRIGSGRLVVKPKDAFPAVTIEWHADGTVVGLWEADVEVFS